MHNILGSEVIMKKTFEILEKIEKARGSLAKAELLKELKGNEFAKWYFETIYNPFLHYGARAEGTLVKSEFKFEQLKDIRDRLVKREVVGNAARDLINSTCFNKWMVIMWNGELKIGISDKSIEKVLGKYIPKFELQLCSGYKAGVIQPGWIVEPKYDGARCVVSFKNDKFVSALSRSGKPIFNIEHIVKEIEDMKPGSCVLDGEIYSVNSNKTVSIVKASKHNVYSEDLKFHIFDMLTPAEFESKKCSTPLKERKVRITWNIKDSAHVRVAPWNEIKNEADAWEYASKYNKEGYEGAVVKDINSMYTFDRAKTWMKLKFQDTLDLEVIAVEEGKGRNAGRLGALVCKLEKPVTFNGKLFDTVNVGSGFNDQQRDEFWKNQNEVIGKTAEVEFQEISEYGVPRFPVFLQIRFDK